MRPLVNDRWRAAFVPEEPGRCVYGIEGWVDHFGSWLRDLHKRIDAGQDVQVDLEIGAALIEERAGRAGRAVAAREIRALREAAERMRRPAAPSELPELVTLLDGDVRALMNRHDPRAFATRYPRELEVVVDRERAAFSAWYELFPRSTGKHGRHGTLATAAEMLPYVAELGFDVVYLPPIHPIGVTKRKGKNNRVDAEPGDVGSPWAIGAEAGGHTAIPGCASTRAGSGTARTARSSTPRIRPRSTRTSIR
jgi:starch synthase (maltosyl-transferring)